jgi:hypothetical protein
MAKESTANGAEEVLQSSTKIKKEKRKVKKEKMEKKPPKTEGGGAPAALEVKPDAGQDVVETLARFEESAGLVLLFSTTTSAQRNRVHRAERARGFRGLT